MLHKQLPTMQRNAWREDVEKLLSSANNNNNVSSSGRGPPENSIMGLSDQQQLLLALQQQRNSNQIDPQALFRFQSNSMDRDSLMGGFGAGLSTGVENGGMSDRMLLAQLIERQRQQQSSYDPMIQQELQRQALARELAERDYERALLQRLNVMNNNPGGLGGLQGFAGLGADALGISQGSALEQSRFSSLLGASQLSGQLNSPLLQGGISGLTPATALGAPALGRGVTAGLPATTFDDSITLEARSKQAFPVKLYRMLERAERNGQDDIISFIDDGKAFAIHKPRAFETDIMPSYFNSHRMSSFQRQLNIYGFERINDGVQKSAYRHKYFIKGKKDLLDKIKRPQKLRHGGAVPEDDEEATKLQTMAAERLVGLSRTSGADSTKSDKSETDSDTAN